METKANFIAVGSFVLALSLGIIFFIIWIGKSEISSRPDIYAIYFKGSISGLKTGAQVLYNGVPVGSVSEISIDKKNIEKVLVLVGIKKGTPVKENAMADLEMQGLTGLSLIQIRGGTQGSSFLQKKPGQTYPVIMSKPSKLETIFNEIPELLHRLNDLISDENQKNVQIILENIAKITTEIANQSEVVEEMLKNINESMKSFGVLTTQLSALIGNNKASLHHFLSTGLFEFTQLISQMKLTFDALGRLTSDVERDPLTFLRGLPERGYKVDDVH